MVIARISSKRGERVDDFAATLYIRAVPQAIEQALARPLGDRDKVVEALTLLRRHCFDQQAMQMRVCACADSRHGALEDG